MKKLGFIALILLAPISAHAGGTRYHAREIKPTSNYVAAAAPGAPASSSHAEGTVVVSDGVSTMEVDVARGAIVARQPFSCGVLHRLSGMLLGSCGGDIVAFDAGLRVTWRAHWATGANVFAKDLFVGGAGRVVATFDVAGELMLRVATTGGAVVSEVRTGAALADARARAHVDVHGTTVLAFASHYAVTNNTLIALSPDGERVAARRSVPSTEFVWDDGTHIHVSDGADDLTLDDALRPIRKGPRAPWPAVRSSIALSEVDGLGGTGVREEFDLGTNHFWYTFGCCGDHPGLYVAKVR